MELALEHGVFENAKKARSVSILVFVELALERYCVAVKQFIIECSNLCFRGACSRTVRRGRLWPREDVSILFFVGLALEFKSDFMHFLHSILCPILFFVEFALGPYIRIATISFFIAFRSSFSWNLLSLWWGHDFSRRGLVLIMAPADHFVRWLAIHDCSQARDHRRRWHGSSGRAHAGGGALNKTYIPCLFHPIIQFFIES